MNSQDLAIAEDLIIEENVVVSSLPSSRMEKPATIEPMSGSFSEEINDFVEVSDENDASDSDLSIYRLKVGQRLVGVVKNIVDFGAFVDVGIPQDGLVHISKLAKHKVEKVNDVVSQGQEIEVWVKKVDTKRGRLSLTMIKPVRRKLKDIVEEAEFEGTVTRLESYGAFVDIDSDRDGLVHISQITHEYIKHPQEALAIGDVVKVKVLNVNRKKRQIDLSIKALLPPPVKNVEEEPPKLEEKPQESKPKKPEPVVKDVIPNDTLKSDEPQLTAMAIAYAAALQDKGVNSGVNRLDLVEYQQKNDMDDIVARTLAGHKKSDP